MDEDLERLTRRGFGKVGLLVGAGVIFGLGYAAGRDTDTPETDELPTPEIVQTDTHGTPTSSTISVSPDELPSHYQPYPDDISLEFAKAVQDLRWNVETFTPIKNAMQNIVAIEKAAYADTHDINGNLYQQFSGGSESFSGIQLSKNNLILATVSGVEGCLETDPITLDCGVLTGGRKSYFISGERRSDGTIRTFDALMKGYSRKFNLAIFKSPYRSSHEDFRPPVFIARQNMEPKHEYKIMYRDVIQDSEPTVISGLRWLPNAPKVRYITPFGFSFDTLHFHMDAERRSVPYPKLEHGVVLDHMNRICGITIQYKPNLGVVHATSTDGIVNMLHDMKMAKMRHGAIKL